MKLVTERCGALPRLGWVAALERGRGTLRVLLGDDVEAGDDFVVEGCWDGDFEALDFDRARCFFGSGLRLVGDALIVRPSCALTDRVLIAELESTTVISNSLVLLLASLGATLDPQTDMRPVCHAIMAGIDAYPRSVPVRSPQPVKVEQCFHRVERIERSRRSTEAAPRPLRLRCYRDYEVALEEALGRIRDNCSARARRTPIRQWTSTSTGYDSTAVSALAVSHGARTSFATAGGRSLEGSPLEDGRPVAAALGLDVIPLRSRTPRPEIELQLLAATFDGRESVFVDMLDTFAESAEAACLWTGYHGDKVWDRATAGAHLGPDIRRGDTSGLNLCEVRLHCGFFNLAVPFIFASSVRDIVAIANAEEMRPWQVGGDYDRPVPRRLAEERGVARELFGRSKSLVMEYYTYPRSRELRSRFLDQLDAEGFGAGRRMLYRIAEIADYRSARLPALGRIPGLGGSARAALRPGAQDLANRLFCWAVNTAAGALAHDLRSALVRPHAGALSARARRTL